MVAVPQHARSVAVLTGAGISAESGVPTFRGEGGLWRSYRPEDLARPHAFRRNPQLIWEWYDWRRGIIGACQPNAAHKVLAEMESHFEEKWLVTQNVDGLHSLAGSRNVVELHGNIWRLRCTRSCRPVWEDRDVPLPELPPRCPDCGSLARPDVVWFGESMPYAPLEAAYEAAQRCQLMLVIGTSALVQPAASLPLLAQESGAFVVEINPQPTPLSGSVDQVIRASATEALPVWWREWLAGERQPDSPRSGQRHLSVEAL